MYDVIKLNTTSLANKELAKSIRNINNAMVTGNKATWTVAEEFTKIINDELFEDDFESEKQFADFVGVSKGYLSQCKSAVEFKLSHEELDLTVSKAYIFSTLENFEDFRLYVFEKYNAQPWEFSDKCIKDFIKEYNNKDNVEEVEEVEEVEDVEENNADIIDANDVMIEVVDNEGTKYIVPLAVLNQYRVEEA